MQLLLGGGLEPDGTGMIADKVIKLPTKRCLDAVKLILDDYETNSQEGEYFNSYYRRQVAADKMYFYKMLKPLADLTTLKDIDYIDWGHTEKYVTEVGVGECAGVMIDLVAILITETQDKLNRAIRNFDKGSYADSIYSSYVTFVSGAKALLTSENINCNTQIGIINDFEEQFVKKGLFDFSGSFAESVLRMNKQEPTKEFAQQYLNEAKEFVTKAVAVRNKQLVDNKF
jgi:sulfite reductase (ferredoxin)